MRFEHNIATVARLAIAQVREILVVESFAAATSLHLWLQRTSLGILAYPGSDLRSLGDLMSLDDLGRINTGSPGCKRGSMPSQPMLVTAGCPAGFASA